jgi:predicted deacylase
MAGRGGTFQVVEHVAPAPGPTVALLGGIHGDEDEGVLAVQQVCAVLEAEPLAAGTVRAVAVAHPAAYAADARVSPLDGLNLARCFPGRADGSATERLAHELTEGVIAGSDLLIDLHSAGKAYAMPSFAGYIEDGSPVAARSRRAAYAFGLPLVWEHEAPAPPGRTVSAALERGIACIYVEGSGGGSLDCDEQQRYVDGVLNVLADLGMRTGGGAAGAGAAEPLRVMRGAGGDLDASIVAAVSGRFIAAARAGAQLAAGDTIGEILDEDGRSAASIVSPADATLVFVRRTARISAGEAVCSFGPPATELAEGQA